jgi:hypothetical protein
VGIYEINSRGENIYIIYNEAYKYSISAGSME